MLIPWGRAVLSKLAVGINYCYGKIIDRQVSTFNTPGTFRLPEHYQNAIS